MRKVLRKTHGGAREHAGRPPKENPEDYVTISCVLRRDTVEQLRDQGRRRLFGPYLQWILDRHPLPSAEEYQAFLEHKPVLVTLPNRRRIPVVISAGSRSRKRRERKVSPELARFMKAYEERADGNMPGKVVTS